ncbi:helix-turn-helix domain-containing protein [Phycicoccus sp. CMS6Z-2]|nr:helix-turn-helix domain-containing protein [Phycicoccus flavus]
MNPNPHRSFESLRQASVRTGMSTKTLRRRIAAGELPAYRSGRLIRVDPTDVDALLVLVPTVGSVTTDGFTRRPATELSWVGDFVAGG